MAESKIKNANYYQIQGWMINALGLKGISLSVFAIIYGFSQDGENEYTGSLQYLCDFTGGTSKPTIIKALKGLVEKQYILRREEYINGVQFNKYKVNLPLLKNFNEGSKEILPGVDKNFNEGSKEILPNNKDNNKALNNETDNKKEEKTAYKQIVDLFNTICVSFPSVRSLSDARKKAIKARLNTYTVDDFKQCFENAEASSFLKGANQRNWTATFDWLIKDQNMAKVLDGNYNDAKDVSNSSFNSNEFFEAAVMRGWDEKEQPKTAADDKNIKARAEALKQQFAGK